MAQEKYNTTLLQSKTVTRIVGVMNGLCKLIKDPIGLSAWEIEEAKRIIEEHKKVITRLPHVKSNWIYERKIKAVLSYKPKSK